MFETLEYNVQKEREQCKLEGEMKKQVEIAKSMLNDNLSITMIMKYTGLSKEEIEKLR